MAYTNNTHDSKSVNSFAVLDNATALGNAIANLAAAVELGAKEHKARTEQLDTISPDQLVKAWGVSLHLIRLSVMHLENVGRTHNAHLYGIVTALAEKEGNANA
jgi:hypothetical protein